MIIKRGVRVFILSSLVASPWTVWCRKNGVENHDDDDLELRLVSAHGTKNIEEFYFTTRFFLKDVISECPRMPRRRGGGGGGGGGVCLNQEERHRRGALANGCAWV